MPNAEVADIIDQLIADWEHERPATTPAAMGVVGRIIRLGRRYEEAVSKMLRPYGVTYSDFDVIATLRRSGPPYEAMPTQLQKNVLLTSGALTACLRRLEAAALISREAGQQDRRRLSAKLTPKGYDLVEALIDRRFAIAQAALGGLNPTEIATIEPLLRRLDG